VTDGRLRWQCRRGMQELDLLLLRYLEQHYADAPAGDKAAFQAFLELPDPELLGYLLYGERPQSAAYDRIVRTVHGEPLR
jgi:antitoxin CptB